jgi:2-C-methyl-D-erythritol 4-phosphate cytidylyltransferase / 2-C-methyl-D-erythritol 2,4-cyclodiphosphate synthase
VFGTDESSLVELAGFPVYMVEGNVENVKLTYPQDLFNAERRMHSGFSDIRIGYGYDVHSLAEGRRLVLGGVEIPHETGLMGHSDADVLLHAITDAILGALALGDIGVHFPDTSAEFKDIDSRILLRKAVELISERGYRIRNLDATLLAEKPKIAPYVAAMREAISQDTGLPEDRISIKATTNEAMGFVGRKEGMAAMATALLSHA